MNPVHDTVMIMSTSVGVMPAVARHSSAACRPRRTACSWYSLLVCCSGRGSTKYSTGKIEWRWDTCALSITVIMASRRRPSRSKTLRM